MDNDKKSLVSLFVVTVAAVLICAGTIVFSKEDMVTRSFKQGEVVVTKLDNKKGMIVGRYTKIGGEAYYKVKFSTANGYVTEDFFPYELNKTAKPKENFKSDVF